MKANKVLTIAALAPVAAALLVTAADAATRRVRAACEGDYNNYCIQYDPNSAEVQRCFESNRKHLSRECIRALVDAGEVPAKYLKK